MASDYVIKLGAKMGPRWGQDGTKMGPRWGQDGAKMGPRLDQDVANLIKMILKGSLDVAKMVH